MRYSKKQKYNTGGQIGSALGSTATSFIPEVGPLLAPLGGMVGGLIGGAVEGKSKVTTPKNVSYGNMGYKYGGKVKPLGKGAKKYIGPKHEDGGILIDEEGNPVNQNEAIAEVEGGETEQDGYIFSDSLIVPNTEMTFAEMHEMLIAEGAPQEQIDELAAMQEQMNGGTNEQEMMQEPMGEQMAEPMMQEMPEEMPEEMMMAKGGLIKRADGSYSRRGLWDNIRANKGSGKKPTPEMLSQERKIKAKEMEMGGNVVDYNYGGVLPKYQDGGTRLYTSPDSYTNPSSRYQSGVRYSQTRPTSLPSSGKTFYGTTKGLTTKTPTTSTNNVLGKTLGKVGKLSGKSLLGAAGLLIPDSNVNAKPLYNSPEEAQQVFGMKPANYYNEPLNNVGTEMFNNAVRGPGPYKPAETRPFNMMEYANIPQPVAQQPVQTRQPSQQVASTTRAVAPTRRFSGNEAQLSEQQLESIRKLKDLRITPKKFNYGGSTSLLEKNPALLQKQIVNNAEMPRSNEFKDPNWGNIATGLQSATRLGAAMFMPKPKDLPRVSYNPISTTSPSFDNARRQAGSGFRTAMGGNPQAAYAQYLGATSNIASQEADFRSQREAMNEQMRQETEMRNLDITARNREEKDMDRAARFGLVSQALDIPVSKMARDNAVQDKLRSDVITAAAQISDPIHRQEFIDNQFNTLNISKKYGGLLKRYKKRVK